jgi:hypothetical protein
MVLQERDMQLLRELAVMRLVDREQAKVVGSFGCTSRVNRRLLALTKEGFLKRFFLATTGGGRRAIYCLSPLGAKTAQVPCRSPRRRNEEVVTVDFFVFHQLGVNGIYCALKHQPIPIVGAKFVRWVDFHEPIGPRESLIPDGYAEISAPTKTVATFVEFDLGHESLSVWKAKMHRYYRYAVSGDFELVFNQPQFRVLVVTNSERRLENLRKTAFAVTDKIFWFTTVDSIQKQGLWSPIWLRPKQDQGPIPLL